MKTLLEKAGYNKFTQEQVVLLEQDILQTLTFKLHGPTSIFNETMSLWTWALQQANLSKNDDDTLKIALEESKTLVIFMCFLCHYSLD